MPVGKAGINHLIHTGRIFRVGNIQQNTVAGTRASRQADLRECRNIVAVVGLVGGLRPLPVIAAFPQPGEHTGIRVGEDKGTVDDRCLFGMGDRNFDDIDAEQR